MKKVFEWLERFAKVLPEKLYLLLAPYFAECRIKRKIIGFTEKQRLFVYRVFDKGGFVRAKNENEKLLCAFLLRQGILDNPKTLRMDRLGVDFVLSSAAQDVLQKLCTKKKPQKKR